MSLETDIYFLKMAKHHSLISPDPSTKVGAIITKPMSDGPHGIIGMGHNCFPADCHQHDEIYADRPRKYLRVVHAEVNAILNCAERGIPGVGGTLYVWPPAAAPTCARCAGVVIQSGIKRVVYAHQDNEFSERWAAEFAEARAMYREAGTIISALTLTSEQFREHFA